MHDDARDEMTVEQFFDLAQQINTASSAEAERILSTLDVPTRAKLLAYVHPSRIGLIVRSGVGIDTPILESRITLLAHASEVESFPEPQRPLRQLWMPGNPAVERIQTAIAVGADPLRADPCTRASAFELAMSTRLPGRDVGFRLQALGFGDIEALDTTSPIEPEARAAALAFRLLDWSPGDPLVPIERSYLDGADPNVARFGATFMHLACWLLIRPRQHPAHAVHHREDLRYLALIELGILHGGRLDFPPPSPRGFTGLDRRPDRATIRRAPTIARRRPRTPLTYFRDEYAPKEPPLDLAALAEAAANRAVGVDRQRLVHGAR